MREFVPDVQTFHKGLSNLGPVLQKMGFKNLRPGQDRAVLNLLNGRDTVAVAPTGGGKSAMYIIPTACHGWRTLVISPLVSLMHDQVTKLWKFGYSAAQISSGQQDAENRMAMMEWEAGRLSFLLVAPERLENENFKAVLSRRKPDCVVVDEAHCISTWGISFRPAYGLIGPMIKSVNPRVVLALTATATSRVLKDIRDSLDIPNADQLIYLPERKNLLLSSSWERSESKLLKKVNSFDGSFIIYCLTVKNCQHLERMIGEQVKGGLSIYHGQLQDAERTNMQQRFMEGEIRGMVATNAFGMGIDKSDIRGIIHWDVPNSVEALSQEVGRAGRDGLDSVCHLYADRGSQFTGKYLLDMNHPTGADMAKVYHYLNRNGAREGLSMTVMDMATRCNLKDTQFSACLGVFRTHGIVERESSTDKLSTVRILKQHPDENFQKIINLVPRLGVAVNQKEAVYEINLSLVAQEVGLVFSTVQNKIKDLAKNGYLAYTPPYRGKTVKLVGELTQEVMDAAQERREDALTKFNKAWEYPDIDDSLKHEFFADYFQV